MIMPDSRYIQQIQKVTMRRRHTHKRLVDSYNQAGEPSVTFRGKEEQRHKCSSFKYGANIYIACSDVLSIRKKIFFLFRMRDLNPNRFLYRQIITPLYLKIGLILRLIHAVDISIAVRRHLSDPKNSTSQNHE